MKRVLADGSTSDSDSGADGAVAAPAGLAFEPVIGLAPVNADVTAGTATHEDADAAVGASRVASNVASSAAGIAIGEPTGDVLGRPIIVGDPIIIIDPAPGDGGSSDGGSYSGGSYDDSYSGQWSTGAGDINGDGFQDSIVYSYSHDAAGTYSSAQYLVFGTAEGAGGDVDLAAIDGANGFRMTEGGRDFCGYASAAGDVNGDGFGDLIVTSYNYDDGSTHQYVVFGRAGGFSAELDLAALDGKDGFSISVQGMAYSYATSIGDVNGDGFDDLRISGYDWTGTGGYVYASRIVYGSADIGTGGETTIELVGDGAQVIIGGDFRPTLDGGEVYGWSLTTVGDINGDGLGDVVIGAYSYAGGGYSGGTWLVFGTEGGFAGALDLGSVAPGQGVQLSDDDAFLYVAAAGDVNDDGFDDLYIGGDLLLGGEVLEPAPAEVDRAPAEVHVALAGTTVQVAGVAITITDPVLGPH